MTSNPPSMVAKACCTWIKVSILVLCLLFCKSSNNTKFAAFPKLKRFSATVFGRIGFVIITQT